MADKDDEVVDETTEAEDEIETSDSEVDESASTSDDEFGPDDDVLDTKAHARYKAIIAKQGGEIAKMRKELDDIGGEFQSIRFKRVAESLPDEYKVVVNDEKRASKIKAEMDRLRPVYPKHTEAELMKAAISVAYNDQLATATKRKAAQVERKETAVGRPTTNSKGEKKAPPLSPREEREAQVSRLTQYMREKNMLTQ